MIDYHVISTGSKGNAVLIHGMVLIDCGVPYKKIEPFLHQIKLILLTHIHGDHFRGTTIRRIAAERPSIRFSCGRWLVDSLIKSGVPERQIDVLEMDYQYDYGIVTVIPVRLTHDVPNCGYKLHFGDGKVFYATDTNNLNGIVAPNYDLYLVESNYTDEDIQTRIDSKKENGQYAYEYNVLRNHLSKAKCDDFIYRNIGPNGSYVYLHEHEDKLGVS